MALRKKYYSITSNLSPENDKIIFFIILNEKINL